MTINEFLKGIPAMKSKDGTTLKDTMMDTVSIWTNDACEGYVVKAMMIAGYDNQQIKEVVAVMRDLFNDMSVEEAEKGGKAFY